MKLGIMLLLSMFAFTYALNFKCLSKYGWGYGTGRYNYNNEYSSYWGVYAKEGEYVLFQYNGYGKTYWFKSEKCEID